MTAGQHLLPSACLLFPAVRDPEWVDASFGHS
jgi:hypothetical protein